MKNEIIANIADRLGKAFYDAEERADPGTHDADWEALDGFTKAVYVEGVYAILGCRDLIDRFFKLSDRDGIIR